MSRIAIIDDYQHAAPRLVDWTLLGPNAEVSFFHDRLVGDRLAEALKGFEVVYVMRERSRITREIFAQLPDLKMVVTNGMANSSIDLVAAKEFGVMVSGTPSGLFSTTEITWALILAVAKGLPRVDADVRAGAWQQELPTDLAGKTLGLLGLGRLGAAMIPIAQAFSMQVIAWSQNLTAARTDELGVQLVTKAELMSESDFISIHVRLSERTTGLIGKDELALMRPTAAIINTARGPVIDERALIEALRTNTICGAGLDVYDVEPMPENHPFNTLKNVVLTPHIGYASESNLLHYMSDAFVNIASYLAGEPLHLLGPDTVH